MSEAARAPVAPKQTELIIRPRRENGARGVGRNPEADQRPHRHQPQTFASAIQTMGGDDMPRPKTPLKLVKAMGLDVRDPGRYGGRSEPVSTALGAPSDFLGEHGREAWEAFRSELPWLMESDRTLVEIACSLRARLFAARPPDHWRGSWRECPGSTSSVHFGDGRDTGRSEQGIRAW